MLAAEAGTEGARTKMAQAPRRHAADRDERSQSETYDGDYRAPDRAALAKLSGSYSDASTANQLLKFAASHCHLISPAPSIGSLQVGCELALSIVAIETATDTYDVGAGKRALHKVALERIGGALGLSWIPEQCGRLDNGSNPHYALFQVAARYRAFDGQMQTVTGWKEMDLRKGSQRCEDIILKAEKTNADIKRNPMRGGKKRYPRDPMDQIRQERANILAHAETKAKLRAIRSIGVPSSFTAEQLQRPIVCARVMFTGKTDDPELRVIFGKQIAASYLDAGQAAYGGAPPVRQLKPSNANTVESASVQGAKVAPPPVGSRHIEDDDDDLDPVDPDDVDEDEDEEDDGGYIARDREPARERDDRRDERKPEPQPQPQRRHVIPGGDDKGKQLSQATLKNLTYWANRLRNELDSEQSRDPEADEDLFDAILAEIKRREAAAERA